MNPTLVQSNTASSGAVDVASLTATYGSTPTQGNLLVAAAGSDATLTMTSTGWSLAVSAINGQAAYIWYKIAGASEATAVKVTPSASDTVVLAIMEYSVSDGWVAAPLDQTATATTVATGNTLASGNTTGATVDPNELAIAISNPHGWPGSASTTPIWTNGFTNIITIPPTTTGVSGADVTLFVASQTLTATGVQSTTSSWTNNSFGCGVAIATFEIAQAPTVGTNPLTGITTTSATGNGTVSSDGGSTITERGIVWNTSPNPTTSNNKVSTSGTTGSYSVSITGLSNDTQYYARAYAINAVGTSYGGNVPFANVGTTTAWLT